MRAAPLPADRADPAERGGDARELRHQAAVRAAARYHPRSRPGARGDDRSAHRDATRSLPPCCGLYTPAMLAVLESDFRCLPELLGRALRPQPEEPGPALAAAGEPAVQLGLEKPPNLRLWPPRASSPTTQPGLAASTPRASFAGRWASWSSRSSTWAARPYAGFREADGRHSGGRPQPRRTAGRGRPARAARVRGCCPRQPARRAALPPGPGAARGHRAPGGMGPPPGLDGLPAVPRRAASRPWRGGRLRRAGSGVCLRSEEPGTEARTRPRSSSTCVRAPARVDLESGSPGETEALAPLAGGLVSGGHRLRLRGSRLGQDDFRPRRGARPRLRRLGHQPDVHDRPPLRRRGGRVAPRSSASRAFPRRSGAISSRTSREMVVFVEWPERAAGALPEPAGRVHLLHAGGDRRLVSLQSLDRALLERVRGARARLRYGDASRDDGAGAKR